MVIKNFFTKRNNNDLSQDSINSSNATKIKKITLSNSEEEEDENEGGRSFFEDWKLFGETVVAQKINTSNEDDKEDTPRENDKERKVDEIDKSHQFYSSDTIKKPTLNFGKDEEELESPSLVFSSNISGGIEETDLNLQPQNAKFTKKLQTKRKNSGRGV